MIKDLFKLFLKFWTYLTDALNELLCTIFDMYSFISTSRIFKIVVTVILIGIVYAGIGLFVYFNMFHKNNMPAAGNIVKSHMVEPVAPEPPRSLQAESKSEIAVHDTAPSQGPFEALAMPQKTFQPKERKSATAPDRQSSLSPKKGKKFKTNPGEKLANVNHGILKVAIKPPTAEVLLDGIDVSTQDMASGKSVEPGSHVILAQAPGYEPYNGSIAVESGVTQILDVVMTKAEKAVGFLHIYSYPWSDLYVDGVLQGTTPTPKPISLQEGEHAVQLKRQGFKPYSDTIRIQKGQVTRVQINLDKSEASGN